MTLAFIILRMLTKEDISGYNLVKKMEQETGWKPSYGSLYPTLNSLKKDGAVSFKISGRKKIYAITPKGRRTLVEFEQTKESIMNTMEKKLMVINKCMGDNPSFLKNMFQMIKKGRLPFGPVTSEAMQLRNILMKMSLAGKIEKNPEKTRAIIKKAVNELSKL